MIGASALSLLMATSASAAGPSPSPINIPVNGNVPAACGVGHQSGGGPGPGYSLTANVALGDITDANGFLSVADKTINFGNIWCNGGATLTLAVTPLSTTTPLTDPDSFDSSFAMEVTKGALTKSIFSYFGGPTQVSSTATTPGSLVYANPAAFETGGAGYAEAILRVLAPTSGGNDRPMAGAYTGSVTLTVTSN
ncbi:MAG: hypothetical protein IT546_07970 [Caulobacteraceae bacterium]|nr:hypothetical protein [Caulobacteraceae bacterium]